MMKAIALLILLIFSFQDLSAQRPIDDPLREKAMLEDLQLFRQIRDAANSGVYKYRTIVEIDSIYQWAEGQVAQSSSHRDFYNILWYITDFEGSLHNSIQLHHKTRGKLRGEENGYFPFPIKLIEGKALINYSDSKIELGAELLSINGFALAEILPHLYKYYTTDGFNLTGKAIGINRNFSLYYRLHFGKTDRFVLTYQAPGSNQTETVELAGIGYKAYYANFKKRHSKVYDDPSYSSSDEEIPYTFLLTDENVGKLTINSFSIGWNAKHPKHLKYVHFLDSVFSLLKDRKVNDLIVDVRHNGGGSDPNDLVTYSYLTSRNFMENTEAWISFKKIPFWKYVKEVSFIMKPFEKHYSDKELQEEFPAEIDGRFYEDATSHDHMVRKPAKHAFEGNIYLLISPRTASAGSLFAAMAAGNENTTTIGKETQGGYYGHNGHIPIRYRLPNSKMKFMFSIVNLQQDVPEKPNQPFGSGVMPDHKVEQSFEDFMQNTDVELNYTMQLIQGSTKN